MNLRQRIVILDKWSETKPAGFIRRHQWFFMSRRTRGGSLYILLFIYLPFGLAMTSSMGRAAATVVALFSLTHLLVSTILIMAAVENRADAKPLTASQKQGYVESLKRVKA